MLAGLIFATEDVEGRGDRLAATLPFGGMTLLEYQARMLITGGASHLLIAVSRMTPALLGAVSRIARRGVPVDIVRSAEEAAAKLHPLAKLIVFADSLVTTDTVVQAMAAEAPDAILVTTDEEGPSAIERVDAGHHWAGIATITAQRVAAIAAMPREYDFQSTLLRVAVQAGADQILLPASAKRSGHGVERDPATLAGRSNGVLMSLANRRVGWADRFVFTPITRAILPQLVNRNVPDWAMMAAGVAIGVIALVLIGLGYSQVGAGIMPLAVVALSAGSLLGWLRGNDRLARMQERAVMTIAALLALALGIGASIGVGDVDRDRAGGDAGCGSCDRRAGAGRAARMVRRGTALYSGAGDFRRGWLGCDRADGLCGDRGNDAWRAGRGVARKGLGSI